MHVVACAGMVSLVLCNFALDAVRLASQWSPLAAAHADGGSDLDIKEHSG